jgi:arginyl-tRNA synthetase
MIQDTLAQILTDAAGAAAPELGLSAEDLPTPELSRPRVREHGDWSTNLALVLASKAGASPRAVAEGIAAKIPTGPLVTRVEVAGPGFVNLFLGHGWLHDALREMLQRGPEFGRGPVRGERIQVEYVSANPTGPLHVGTARNAALGDSLANLLHVAGYDVEREYYFNDAGRQLELYAQSVEARYLQRFGVHAEIPEGGYQGDQVAEIAERLASEHGDAFLNLPPDDRREAILRAATAIALDGIRGTLERFRVHMDTWVNEREFHDSDAIAQAVELLRQRGFAYDQDGAVFFRATEFGDGKDRVLIRSNGQPTYFGADCAYLLHKAARGFDRLIYVWGADHHGTVKRLLGAADALEIGSEKVEVVLYQLVHLYRGGEPVRMSRRAGDYVTLDELLDEVGVDGARYTLLTRSNDSAIDFDIEAVTRQSMDNPVYYVQYAHARIGSLLRVAAEQGVTVPRAADAGGDVERLETESELDLIRTLAEYPEVIETAAQVRAPHRLTRYAEEVAAAFHRFYTECRIITDDGPLTGARLLLSTATKDVIASALGVIGVTAPESMDRLDEREGESTAGSEAGP